MRQRHHLRGREGAGAYFVGIDCAAVYARLAASRLGCPCLSFAAERKTG